MRVGWCHFLNLASIVEDNWPVRGSHAYDIHM